MHSVYRGKTRKLLVPVQQLWNSFFPCSRYVTVKCQYLVLVPSGTVARSLRPRRGFRISAETGAPATSRAPASAAAYRIFRSWKIYEQQQVSEFVFVVDGGYLLGWGAGGGEGWGVQTSLLTADMVWSRSPTTQIQKVGPWSSTVTRRLRLLWVDGGHRTRGFRNLLSHPLFSTRINYSQLFSSPNKNGEDGPPDICMYSVGCSSVRTGDSFEKAKTISI